MPYANTQGFPASETECLEDSTPRGRGTNRRVQAVRPSSAPEPVSQEDSTQRDELEELGQLINEEVPKTETRLAKLVTNHKTLEAGQKMKAAASFSVGIVFAVFFLSHFRNAYIKVKNDRAADTIKEQKELCCEIDDSMKKLTDKMKSIVSKVAEVSSGRQSDGAAPAERINKTPAELFLYQFKSGMGGYEYKSDVLEKVEYVRADIARIKSFYDWLSKM